MSFPRSAPSSQGVGARGIHDFLDAVHVAPGVEMHSMMLLRHGHVVAEGWWAPYSPERTHLLYSLSKSFTSTALGLAVAEGLVGLDDTVLSHFPELDGEITDPRSRRMRVRHVAAMASGHTAETIMRASELDSVDLVRGFLLIAPDEEPGSVFAYNQPCTFAIAAIIQRAAGMTLTEYLRPRLFDPLGISSVGWFADNRGRELGFSGLHATTDAIAKLGQLYLQRGEWHGTQILSAEWVDEATRTQVANPHEENVDWSQGYGFQFWMARHGYRGDGAYGQFCVVLPEQDAVLAITGQSIDMQAVLTAAWEHLLPAFERPTVEAAVGSDTGAGAGDAAERELATRLAEAELPPAAGAAIPPGVRTYAAAEGSRVALLSEVTVDSGRDGTTLTLVDGTERLVVRAGNGEWVTLDATAASGGVTSAGAAVFEVIFLETPHRLRIECAGATFAARWITEPLHPVPLTQMRMPRVR